MKNYLTIILFLMISCVVNAQANSNEYKNVDEKIAQFSITNNNNAVGELVEFINNNFSTETDKLRATFVWITENFEYDVENQGAVISYSETQEVIDTMLKNKKGVCMHFAFLFNDIANKLGIKTYVICGYTKQKSVVNSISHSWCIGLVDSTWYFFDPTWGAGYILNNKKYVKKRDNFYFKTVPENLIKSHIPFDPLWQFLYYPITSQEFYDGQTEINKDKIFFNFVDTLKAYENQTKIQQLISANNRIQQNGIKNVMIRTQIQDNTNKIGYFNYDSAINFYNEGVFMLNIFINYRNKQFTPQKTEVEVRRMVTLADSLFLCSQNLLKTIITTDKNITKAVNQLKLDVVKAIMTTDEQKNFVDEYYSTKKIFRKSLFYKYTWFGIPLN